MKERKDLVVSEATKMAEEEYRVKAVAQGQQGRWTWEGGCELSGELVRPLEPATGPTQFFH